MQNHQNKQCIPAQTVCMRSSPSRYIYICFMFWWTHRRVVPTASDDGRHHGASEISLRGCTNGRPEKSKRKEAHGASFAHLLVHTAWCIRCYYYVLCCPSQEDLQPRSWEICPRGCPNDAASQNNVQLILTPSYSQCMLPHDRFQVCTCACVFVVLSKPTQQQGNRPQDKTLLVAWMIKGWCT